VGFCGLFEVQTALATVSLLLPWQAPWLATDHGHEGYDRVPSGDRRKSHKRTVSGFKLGDSISSGEKLRGSTSDVTRPRRPKPTSTCAFGLLLAGRRCPANFGGLRNNISLNLNPLSCSSLLPHRDSSSSSGGHQQGGGDCCCARSSVVGGGGEEGAMTVSLAEIAIEKGELRVHGEPLLSNVPSNVVFTVDGESSHSGFLGASFPESSSHHVVSLGVLQ
jgi:hypothetical protein